LNALRASDVGMLCRFAQRDFEAIVSRVELKIAWLPVDKDRERTTVDIAVSKSLQD
jgi:hypothetical protein